MKSSKPYNYLGLSNMSILRLTNRIILRLSNMINVTIH
ncbi:hypothetical protein SVI_1982 [Shewanella violacea DSS12]|uniref:Uncharacterized protein n=1 Tax=Shewanella violacea (strain JCM 10179 / CIP 106290 / LMG 19151 / DSS12) TaxID=637905 RepID=D4ZJV4_SHEVD|nr:hypothetical protein SVI_1982 [Shewanella violacea DSS12]